METHYNQLLELYDTLLEILKYDNRAVSKEMVQVIKDEIEDIMIELGRASQIQPSLFDGVGFETN